MSVTKKNWSRRDFMKIAGAASVGAVVAPVGHLVGAVDKTDSDAAAPAAVPTRPFGRSGVDVSILSLGGTVNFLSNQLLLKQALMMGVTCWDTSRNYIGGNSEKGIGKYFKKFPEDRQKVFLMTKSGNSNPDDLTQHLYDSLQRMKTDYIDLFLIQAVSNVQKQITKDMRTWAERAKSSGKIRLFGFSTHKNMENCLIEGAQLGWIDGIMTTYNYRLMHTDNMKKAVAACTDAGIGLIAMKTQAALVAHLFSKVGNETATAKKLHQQFMDKGFSTEQAKLKSVWESPVIASICSHMPNMKLLQANTSAAVNETVLSATDKHLMEQHAGETASSYCTGCAQICEQAIADAIPVSDIMRYLMYYSNYDDPQEAVRLFNGLPIATRRRISHVNYSKAEQRCPQKMPITQLMKKAVANMEGELQLKCNGIDRKLKRKSFQERIKINL